ncbi:hypothetical protein HN51_040803 [Arachis hypogaea]|uniref:Peptidase A1 domain-containing protein n=1 Tax=Arachis hypogaea TaxID=3818 RepID=A0A444YPT7_ARAHY|nr:probable aspartyl protease At4g16563 [Arachis ipaensis]XP_025658054.1 probable aspartyl protease At4g16563 [Arachis hypogaea]QHN86466.1 aspartic proteinase nepenthesin [Arachis hypogaea]RYR03983.1 hypothetical protein Ahy_B06g083475 [Arachis hypogaea]
MATYFHILCILSLTLLSLTPLSSSSNTIKLSLSPFFTNQPSSSSSASQPLLQALKFAASASLSRAHHLKNRKSSESVTTPVFAKSYGSYSVDLSFGTPPQTFPFVLDTGSSLVWFPCSSRYLCSNCNFPNIDPSNIHTFIPKNSSTARFVGCTNPKCDWIFGSDPQSRCPGCQPGSPNCALNCPAYIIQYGLGSTAGLLLLDNLDFPGKIVTDFLVGCSILSVRQPAGIAGFGRGKESLPSQMNLKRFSYCLVSHRFDDAPVKSDLILHIGSSGGSKTAGVSYTPFRANPAAANNSAFGEYYYVTLRKILVGGKRVKAPYALLEPGLDGNGGTIVDSGSTFTFMEKPVFEVVAKEFEKQMKNFTRAKDVEDQSGLSPCFDFKGSKTVPLPELTFQFKGGAKMTLPVADYFSLVGRPDVACLTIVTDGGAAGPARAGGPSIILGNYQQQNYYVEYDLENQRFGFRPQNCQKSV